MAAKQPRWPAPESRSRAIFERARRVLPGGISRLLTWVDPFPVYARRGQGAYIEDEDGTRRLDFMNNFASLIHGHAHPAVVEAAQAAVGDGTCFALPGEREVALAEVLCARITRVEKVRFCNSGTEAVMLALKAARARSGRPRIAKVEGAYHGMYDYAEVSLDPTPEGWGNAPQAVAYAHGTPRSVLDDTVVLPFNQPEEAERILRATGDTLAAVLIDPVPATAGMVPGTFEYLQTVQRVAREIGARVIVDEVIALRLAYRGAQSRFFLEPDLTVLGKIIGGGFPVGAVGGTDEAMAVFSHERGKPLNPSSGTFTGNPVTMAAGLATMGLLTAEAYDQLEALGEHARAVVRAALAGAGVAWQVTGVGSMLQLHPHDREIVDYRSAFPAPAEAAALRRVHRALLERGFILSPRCAAFLSTANTFDQLERFAEALGEVLAAL